MSKQTGRRVVMQVVLSDGTEVTLRASQPLLTASSVEELQAHLMAYLSVCEWVLRRREAKRRGEELAASIFSWWYMLRGKGEQV